MTTRNTFRLLIAMSLAIALPAVGMAQQFRLSVNTIPLNTDFQVFSSGLQINQFRTIHLEFLYGPGTVYRIPAVRTARSSATFRLNATDPIVRRQLAGSRPTLRFVISDARPAVIQFLGPHNIAPLSSLTTGRPGGTSSGGSGNSGRQIKRAGPVRPNPASYPHQPLFVVSNTVVAPGGTFAVRPVRTIFQPGQTVSVTLRAINSRLGPIQLKGSVTNGVARFQIPTVSSLRGQYFSVILRVEQNGRVQVNRQITTILVR